MGEKGSGRPKGSTKPLSKYLVGLQEDLEEIAEHVELANWMLGIQRGKLDNLRRKIKLEEYRRRMRRTRKR